MTEEDSIKASAAPLAHDDDNKEEDKKADTKQQPQQPVARVIRLTADGQQLYLAQDVSFLATVPNHCCFRIYSSGIMLVGTFGKSPSTRAGAGASASAVAPCNENKLASALVGETLHGDFEVFCYKDARRPKETGITTVSIGADGQITLVPSTTAGVDQGSVLLKNLVSASVGPKSLSEFREYLEVQDTLHKQGVQSMMAFWWHDLGAQHRYRVVLPRGVADTKLLLVKNSSSAMVSSMSS